MTRALIIHLEFWRTSKKNRFCSSLKCFSSAWGYEQIVNGFLITFVMHFVLFTSFSNSRCKCLKFWQTKTDAFKSHITLIDVYFIKNTNSVQFYDYFTVVTIMYARGYTESTKKAKKRGTLNTKSKTWLTMANKHVQRKWKNLFYLSWE